MVGCFPRPKRTLLIGIGVLQARASAVSLGVIKSCKRTLLIGIGVLQARASAVSLGVIKSWPMSTSPSDVIPHTLDDRLRWARE